MIACDGVAIWFQHIVKVVSARGEPVTRQGLGINIAERKRAREEDLPLFAQVLSQRATMIPVDDLVVSHRGGFFLRLVFGQVPRIRLREPPVLAFSHGRGITASQQKAGTGFDRRL